ncbi:hypothetical protein A1OE_928 [Candidatus Endolissoclinum faulkneri L2]|uniref:Uncharacterized protein n=1 Tax=Candidatus Endolissoclinum faulkneri L2 TaxID=1193729 RepID=K7ZD23_9PROT|nr:hypothetical protein A1OE_928 [Candidatus Endolissoclinum faulkneri L2]
MLGVLLLILVKPILISFSSNSNFYIYNFGVIPRTERFYCKK